MQYEFILRIYNDGSIAWRAKYNNALDAVNAYNKVTDYGFAKFEREAMLVEPNGTIHSKLFQVPYGMTIA